MSTPKSSKAPAPSRSSAPLPDLSMPEDGAEEADFTPPAAPADPSPTSVMLAVEHEACARAVCEMAAIFATAKGIPMMAVGGEEAIAMVSTVMGGGHLGDHGDENDHALRGLMVRTIRSMASALGWSGPGR